MLRFLTFLAAMLLSLPAAAVSCGGEVSVREAFSTAQDVFSAHVEETYRAPGFGQPDFQFAKLRVLQVWKGDLRLGDQVSTTAEDSVNFVSDGFVPLEGTDVLLYVAGIQPFVLSVCSRSALLAGNADLRKLERLSKRAKRR
jgi:hypothetical protein